MVSHDRDFLNSVTTDIIHLHDQRLHGYRGNFAQFEDMYEQKRKEVNKVADKFEKQMKAAKKSGSRATQDKVCFCSAFLHAQQHYTVPADVGAMHDLCLALLSLLRCGSPCSWSLCQVMIQKASHTILSCTRPSCIMLTCHAPCVTVGEPPALLAGWSQPRTEQPMSSFTRLRQQVAKSAKEAVKRKGKGAPAYVDDTPSNADAPRRWNDYTVHFEFPDPSDVGNSLIQLMDVDFKYPGRDDFGLQVIFVAAGCAESL